MPSHAGLAYSACVRKPPVSISVLLPLLSLTLWLVLVPTGTASDYFSLSRLSPGSSRIEFGSPEFRVSIPRDHLLSLTLISVTHSESHLISAINMPGMAGELLFSIPTWPDSWHPSSLPFECWRALSWPFFCLPAWWFAGRGADALLGWRRPRWWTLLVGSLLFAVFATLFFGFRFGMSAEERSGDIWILQGCALWTLLLATFPAVWIRRAFARKPAAPTLPPISASPAS